MQLKNLVVLLWVVLLRNLNQREDVDNMIIVAKIIIESYVGK